MIALAIIEVVSLATLALIYVKAPLGWEDAQGFHRGIPPHDLAHPDQHSSDMLGKQGRGVSHHVGVNTDA